MLISISVNRASAVFLWRRRSVSFPSNGQAAPKASLRHQHVSRTETTNQPAPLGSRPPSVSISSVSVGRSATFVVPLPLPVGDEPVVERLLRVRVVQVVVDQD